jgi:hypothetical protein
MWKQVVGILPLRPGFAEILVQPQVDCARGPAGAHASLLTPRGLLDVSWRRDGRTTTLNVTLPLGSTATVVVPKPCESDGAHTAAAVTVRDSGQHVWSESQPSAISSVDGVRVGARAAVGAGRSVALSVKSGTYSFVASAEA